MKTNKYDGLAHLRLRIARIARGYMNQKIFAMKCATPTTTYWSHESGEYELRASDLAKYNSILDVSLNWLITGEGSPLGHYKKPDPEAELIFYKITKVETEKYEIDIRRKKELDKIKNNIP